MADHTHNDEGPIRKRQRLQNEQARELGMPLPFPKRDKKKPKPKPEPKPVPKLFVGPKKKRRSTKPSKARQINKSPFGE